METIHLRATSFQTPKSEPVLWHKYPKREETWIAEVVWSDDGRDTIDLTELLRQVCVDFHFVDLGVLRALQDVFEEEIAPTWENQPVFTSRIVCLQTIKNAILGMFMWFIHAGYLRETIHRDHGSRLTAQNAPQAVQSGPE